MLLCGLQQSSHVAGHLGRGSCHDGQRVKNKRYNNCISNVCCLTKYKMQGPLRLVGKTGPLLLQGGCFLSQLLCFYINFVCFLCPGKEQPLLCLCPCSQASTESPALALITVFPHLHHSVVHVVQKQPDSLFSVLAPIRRPSIQQDRNNFILCN